MPQLDWLILANYAEAPPGGGLVYIMGGAWDTVTVGAPLQGAPPGIVAVIAGHLAIRLEFHVTETNREHQLELSLRDEDGAEVAKIDASFRVDRAMGLPTSWNQGMNLVVPLTGIGLPKFGVYELSVSVNGAHMGSRPFRVLKGY